MKVWVKRLLYNPRRVAREDSRISIQESTILLDSARFHFRAGKGGSCSLALGADSMIGCNFIFESDQGKVVVGQRTYIGGGTQIISRSSVKIGDDVTIGWGVYLYDHSSHSLDWKERTKDISRQNEAHRSGEYLNVDKDWSTVKTAPITICDKAWIGFDAVILKGVTVGEGAVVSARACVTRDVEPWTIVAGNPATVIKKLKD